MNDTNASLTATSARLRRMSVWAALVATAVLAFEAFANGCDSDLHYPAGEGDVAEVTRLLDAGADPNACAGDGDTPLHLAAEEGHVEVVRLLLDRGADLNASGDYGRTPLHSAAGGGDVEVVRLLLDRGADLNASDARAARCVRRSARQERRSVSGFFQSRARSSMQRSNTSAKAAPAAAAASTGTGSLRRRAIVARRWASNTGRGGVTPRARARR